MSAITLLNPYQKMGTPIPDGMTTAEALAHTGLAGWNQRLVEPLIMDGGKEYRARNGRALIADLPTGPTTLGFPTTRYQPIQNEEAFTPLIDTYGEVGLTPVYAGAYDGGRATFVCFQVPGTARIAGDAVQPYLLASKRNDGGGSAQVHPSAVRVACGNAITAVKAASRPLVSVRHTRNADPNAVQTAEVLLGLTQDWTALLAQDLQALAATKVTKNRYIKDVVPAVLTATYRARPEDTGASQTIWDRKFEELVASWDSPAAATGSTAWRAYSAVTEWEQHHRSKNQDTLARCAITGWAPAGAAALAALGA